MKAAYLAEAGAHEAIARLKRGEVAVAGETSQRIAARAFAEGQFEAYMKRGGTQGVILSVGIVKQAKRQVTVNFEETAGNIRIVHWAR